MMFVPMYEPVCRLVDDTVVSLGLFNSYEEANDAAIYRAAEKLPQESVKAYQIIKSYINTAAMDFSAG